MTGGVTQGNILREVESLTPVDNLAVGVVRIFGAERGPAD